MHYGAKCAFNNVYVTAVMEAPVKRPWNINLYCVKKIIIKDAKQFIPFQNAYLIAMPHLLYEDYYRLLLVWHTILLRLFQISCYDREACHGWTINRSVETELIWHIFEINEKLIYNQYSHCAIFVMWSAWLWSSRTWT